MSHGMNAIKDQAASLAGQAASAMGKNADQLASRAGVGMQELGEQLCANAPEGVLGQASKAVAGQLKRGGQYIEGAKFSGMSDDLATTIRHNPISAVLIGIGLGVLLGRAMRSSA